MIWGKECDVKNEPLRTGAAIRTMKAALKINAYTYQYPGADAPVLEGVSLTVGRGECVCLSGPSGSGKTTLLLAVKGLLKGGRASGAIRIAGLHSMSSSGMVFQNAETQILCTTVEDEAAFGPQNQGWPLEDIQQRVRESLEMVDLAGFETRNVEHLSAGEKHRLAIASVLSMSPRLLLLDEPAAQLDSSGKKQLVNILKGLKEREHALLIADHELALFSGLADRCYLIEHGSVKELPLNMPLPGSVFPPLGASEKRITPHGSAPLLVRIRDLQLAGANGHPLFDGLDLELRRGSLVHILGGNGAGKSTLLRCMAGFTPPDAGTIQLTGVPRLRPEALLGKVGFMFQNPERQLFEETVYEEVGFSLRRLGIARPIAHERIMEALARCEVDHLRGRSPLTLSFGEQHRVAMASTIAPRPEILLLDEPFAGLDFRQRSRMLGILSRLREERGTTVLLASHEYLPERKWADQTLVLKDGKINAL